MLAIRHSIVLCVIGVQCLIALTLGRSVSIVGDVVIDISNERFLCDKIECPAATDRCVVIKQNDINDTSILIRSDSCYSQTNEVLLDLITKEAMNPESKVYIYIEKNRYSIVSTTYTSGSRKIHTSSSGFDEEKFHKYFQQHMNQFHHKLNSQMESLNKNLNEMGSQMENAFG